MSLLRRCSGEWKAFDQLFYGRTASAAAAAAAAVRLVGRTGKSIMCRARGYAVADPSPAASRGGSNAVPGGLVIVRGGGVRGGGGEARPL